MQCITDGSGDDTLYTYVDGTLVATRTATYHDLLGSRPVWKDFTPTSIVVNTSDGTTGDVTDVQTMFDGNVYQVEEAGGTPGYDFEFIFSGIDRYPTLVVARWLYVGVGNTHDVTIGIWNYGSSAWDELRVFNNNAYHGSITMYLPQNISNDYVSGGAAKIRFYHQDGGATAHYIAVDYVGLTNSLQGEV